MILGLIWACSLQKPITIIAANIGDVISLVHVESILTRAGIPHENHYGGHEVIARASASTVLALLDTEAPRVDFNLYAGGVSPKRDRRGDLDIGKDRWRHVIQADLLRVESTPFSVRDLLNAVKCKPQSVRELTYYPRSYLGPDMKYHLGFEISLKAVTRKLNFQILGDEGKQMITVQQGIDSDLPPTVELKPLRTGS